LLDPIEINLRNREELATIHARDATGDYVLERFRAGKDALHVAAQMRRAMQALEE